MSKRTVVLQYDVNQNKSTLHFYTSFELCNDETRATLQAHGDYVKRNVGLVKMLIYRQIYLYLCHIGHL